MDRRTGHTMSNTTSNPFWHYSLATYRLDGMAPSCLALQDTFGLDVNMLLYASWLAYMDQRLSDEHAAGVEVAIVDWRDRVVKPLRALRRQLQDYPRAEGVMEEMKGLELRAEQQQQDMMFAFFQRTAGLPQALRPLRENLLLVARFANPKVAGWELTIDHLVTLFPL
jgi:uncharacterized protein (TIGR02444 family)